MHISTCPSLPLPNKTRGIYINKICIYAYIYTHIYVFPVTAATKQDAAFFVSKKLFYPIFYQKKKA